MYTTVTMLQLYILYIYCIYCIYYKCNNVPVANIISRQTYVQNVGSVRPVVMLAKHVLLNMVLLHAASVVLPKIKISQRYKNVICIILQNYILQMDKNLISINLYIPYSFIQISGSMLQYGSKHRLKNFIFYIYIFYYFINRYSQISRLKLT